MDLHEYQLLAGLRGRLEESMSFSQAQGAAIRALKKVRPGGGRSGAVKAMVAALTADPTVMDWFAHFSKVDGYNIRDLLGEPLASWKDWNDIPENSPAYDSLTATIAPLIVKALIKYKPSGAVYETPPDYSTAKFQTRELETTLDNLQYDPTNEALKAKARDLVARITKILG